MKFLIINGPNLNMLGIREPDLYGTLTYDGLVEYVAAEARRLGVEAEFYQSNHEGDLVTAKQGYVHAMAKLIEIIRSKNT